MLVLLERLPLSCICLDFLQVYDNPAPRQGLSPGNGEVRLIPLIIKSNWARVFHLRDTLQSQVKQTCEISKGAALELLVKSSTG